MSPRLLPLVAGVVAIAAAVLSAQPPSAPGPNDWPQWRGPNRDGKSAETGLLQSWPKDGPPKAWTVGGLGTGFGTPSVAAGKIYVMGAEGGKDGIICLAESDGKKLWFTPIDDARKGDPNLGPGSQPTVHNGMVYAVSNRGTLAALDVASGKVVWAKNYKADLGGGDPGNWGFNDSVLVDGDRVICAPSGKKAAMAALDAKTGATVWVTSLDKIGGGAGYCSPVKMTVGSIPTYVCLLGSDAGIVGVHADSGKLLWQYTGKGASGNVAQIPTPVIAGNRVVVSCSYNRTGGLAVLDLTPGGTEKINVEVVNAYEKPELNNHHGGMVLIEKHVFFGHDQNKSFPACVDVTTGKFTYKEDRQPFGNGSVAVTFADGRLYYRFESGVLALVEPDPTQFKMVSSFKLPEPSGRPSWAHPVVANGRLYIRDQQKLHCFNVKATTN